MRWCTMTTVALIKDTESVTEGQLHRYPARARNAFAAGSAKSRGKQGHHEKALRNRWNSRGSWRSSARSENNLRRGTSRSRTSSTARTHHPRVLLGMDTRESSSWIAAVLAAGLADGGAHVENAGVITTPAIAYLARQRRLFRRRRHLRLPQSLAGQWHQEYSAATVTNYPTKPSSASRTEIFRQPRDRSKPRQPAILRPPVNNEYRADYERFLRSAVPGLESERPRVSCRLRQRSRFRHRARTLRASGRKHPPHPRVSRRPQHQRRTAARCILRSSPRKPKSLGCRHRRHLRRRCRPRACFADATATSSMETP